ncbi:MAG: aminopeptidase, partial [Acidimicrobiia bacterium]
MPSGEMLRKYADVALIVGLGTEPGDRILIDAPVQTAEFVRLLVEQGYSAGAHNVDVLWRDDGVSRARF